MSVHCWPMTEFMTVVMAKAELEAQLSEGHASSSVRRLTAAGI